MREEADAKFAAARFVQALAVARGLIEAKTPAQKTWLDRGQRVDVAKAADVGLDDFTTPAGAPISDSILALTRTASIPQRLVGLRSMPFNTKFYVQTAAITATQIAESKPIPVFRGNWATTTLTPRKFAAMTVATNELIRASPQAFQALVADLAQAVGAAESAGFVDPNEVGSVLNGTSTFASTGTTLAAVDADLKHLIELVPAAFRGAATFVMCGGTALYLSQLRGSGGALAYPSMTATGGTLLGLPVLVTEAMEFDDSPVSRAIGLIDSSRIFYNSGGAMLTVSSQAALEMSGAPRVRRIRRSVRRSIV